MEFFKKKNLLTIAALFAACVLFIGCGETTPTGPDDPEDPEVPIDPTEGVSLLTADFEESWVVFSATQGEDADPENDGLVEELEFDAEDPYVQWIAKYNDVANWDVWNYASVAFFFGPDEEKGTPASLVLTSSTKIEITYESDGHFQFELIPLVPDGTYPDNYMAILPGSGGAGFSKTFTLDLNKVGGYWTEMNMEGWAENVDDDGVDPTSDNNFRIPAWCETDPELDDADRTWELKLNEIEAFAFNTANTETTATENWIKITNIKIIDGTWAE